MKIFFLFLYFLCLLPLCLANQDSLATPTKTGVVITLEETVDGGMASYVKRAIHQALSQNPDYIIFEVNTFGGELMAAFEIVDEITAIHDVQTVAFVQKKAISAGALISLACHAVYMSPSSTIGDVAPVVQGDAGPVVLGEKIQSPLRAKFRNLSQRNGYPELLSQAMVTQALEIIEVQKGDSLIHFEKRQFDAFPDSLRKSYTYIKTLVRADELLTMTDKEAQKYGFSKGTIANLKDLKSQLGISESKAVSISWSENLTRFITAIAPILMMIGFGALYMEYQTPGFGFFGITGIIALCIVFAGPYLAGLAEHTEIALLVLAITLTFVEMFLFPGTFISGFAGIALFVVALAIVFSRQKGIESFPDTEVIFNFLSKILFSSALALVFPLFSAKFILPRLSRRSNLMLSTTAADLNQISQITLSIGDLGVSISPLRPSGTAEFDEKRFDVISHGGMIEPGESITVIEIRNNHIFVEPTNE